MKTVFLASVAAATLIAAPAFAQDAVGSAGIGYVHSDTEGFKTDGAQLDGVGANLGRTLASLPVVRGF